MYHRKRRRSHRRCSVRNVVFRTFQKSQENTYARVSLLIHAATLLKNKKETLAQLFRVSFMKFLRTLFFHSFQSTASRSREDRIVVFFTSSFLFFLFFRGLFTILLAEYFSVEQKQSPGGVLQKRRLKYLTEFIRKHLRRSLFFEQRCSIETCNFIKKRLRLRCFALNFANFLRTPILQNICKCISYCENIYHIAFLVTYLGKNW